MNHVLNLIDRDKKMKNYYYEVQRYVGYRNYCTMFQCKTRKQAKEKASNSKSCQNGGYKIVRLKGELDY